MSGEAGHPERPAVRGQLRARAAARGAERRRRLWWSAASWATTVLIVVAVGLLVHWRVTGVLREAEREKEAEAAIGVALRAWRAAPDDPERSARLRATIAAYPGAEAARKAEEELARVERARAVQGQPPHTAGRGGQERD
ncbi:MAG: hypothetical protein FJ291_29780 [Planctomycetes bacterium]|nr:hypothetical protein [Planctomycetota bacterium]